MRSEQRVKEILEDCKNNLSKCIMRYGLSGEAEQIRFYQKQIEINKALINLLTYILENEENA